MSLKPWEQTWNGRTWRDMPPYCGSEDEKKMNFFFWRRGKLDVEDEVKCEELAQDGIVEIVDGAQRRPLPRLVSCFKRRFGNMGRRAVRKDRTAELRAAEKSKEDGVLEEAFRAELKLRLLGWRQKHSAAMKQIAAMTGVNYDNLCKFTYTGKKVALDKLRVVSALLDDLDSGVKVLEESRRGKHSRVVDAPEGHIPFKRWVQQQAEEQGLKPHSVYARLKRNPELLPPIFRVHGRAWFVPVAAMENKEREEVAA